MLKHPTGNPRFSSDESVSVVDVRQHVYVPPPFQYNPTRNTIKPTHGPIIDPPPIRFVREGMPVGFQHLSIVASIIVFILAILVTIYRK